MSRLEIAYRWRAASAEDFAALARFVHHYDTTVGEYSDFSEEDLREFERMKRFDYASDSWVAEGAGEIAAFGLSWPNGQDVIYAFGIVHPEHTGRNLGSSCLSRAEANALRQLEKTSGVLRSFVDARDTSGCRLHSARGYRLVRRQYTMHRYLPAPAGPPLPAEIEVRTARRDEGPLLHALVDETFAEHWGHVPRAFEDFEAEVLQRADTQPDLWWIAEEEGEAVGVLIGCLDRDTGWVADLGVRKGWRGRGIGLGLLHVAFDEFARRGAVEVALGVDASNETGAVRLYERAGMSARKVYGSYELPIASL